MAESVDVGATSLSSIRFYNWRCDCKTCIELVSRSDKYHLTMDGVWIDIRRLGYTFEGSGRGGFNLELFVARRASGTTWMFDHTLMIENTGTDITGNIISSPSYHLSPLNVYTDIMPERLAYLWRRRDIFSWYTSLKRLMTVPIKNGCICIGSLSIASPCSMLKYSHDHGEFTGYNMCALVRLVGPHASSDVVSPAAAAATMTIGETNGIEVGGARGVSGVTANEMHLISRLIPKINSVPSSVLGWKGVLAESAGIFEAWRSAFPGIPADAYSTKLSPQPSADYEKYLYNLYEDPKNLAHVDGIDELVHISSMETFLYQASNHDCNACARIKIKQRLLD